MQGWIRTFFSDRSFGFIQGDDGKDYFFHLDDVRGREDPTPHSEVTFNPARTSKGLRARSVSISQRAPRAEKIYLNPNRFIMTREPEVRGYIIMAVVIQDAWGESNDPNEAKDMLRKQAEWRGANAVVDLRLEKYSQRSGCSNYFYTMHRFHGRAVIIKKVGYTTDPQAIARSREEMGGASGSTFHSVGDRALVRPPWWRFVPAFTWSMCRTLGLISLVALRQILTASITKRTRGQEVRGAESRPA